LSVWPALSGRAGPIGARNAWLAGSGCIVAILLITAAYYLPINARFAGRSVPLEQVPAALDTWLLVHNVRIALAALASVLGVVAISRGRGGAEPADSLGVGAAR
jgi:Domain of unknown function (DUF1772)